MIQRHNGLDPDTKGAFVYYDDHLAAIAEKDAEVEILRANIIMRDELLAEGDKELARWKAVSPDRCDLEYIIALEKEITTLKAREAIWKPEREQLVRQSEEIATLKARL